METSVGLMASPTKKCEDARQAHDGLDVKEPLQIPRVYVMERKSNYEVHQVGCHHLRGDVRRFGQSIWYIPERRPDSKDNSIDAECPVVRVDTIPEKAYQHANEHCNERGEETEARSALNGVWYVVLCSDDRIGGDGERYEKVAKEDDADGFTPRKAEGHDTGAQSKVTGGDGIA
jgi:hypothetical protein